MVVNYYETLEVPSDADEREIKRAYHRLARDLHPDKASSPDEARSLEEKFALVSAAYNTLKDPAKRTEHDKRVQANTTASGQSSNITPLPRKATATAAVLQAPRGVPAPTTKPASGAPATSPRPSDAGAPRPGAGLTPQRIGIGQKAFAKGMQFYKEANYVKAIEFFDAAIQNNDTEAVYFARLATALIQAKKSATRAIDAAQRAIDLDPYNLDHKFDLAAIYETIGSKTNAQKIYEEILRWDAGNARALMGLTMLKKRRASVPFGPQTTPLPTAAGGFLGKILSHFKK